MTYGTGVTGEAFQFNDTAGERVVVADSGFLSGVRRYALGLDQPE